MWPVMEMEMPTLRATLGKKEDRREPDMPDIMEQAAVRRIWRRGLILR